MASSLTPGFLVMSDLLTIREKGVLFTLLEPQCKLIKTTVAQVLLAKETQGERPGWNILGCGTVCLIEDESVPSYFLRLYCVKRAKLLWEQELYIPFKYTEARTFFHTFPADGHQVGLNFANETEAEEFYIAVEAIKRHQEHMTGITEITNGEEEDSSTSDPPDSGIEPPHNLDSEQHFPVDAPLPEVTPITSPYSGLDPTMRRLLMQARLTEEDLKDKDVAEAVDCIINQFGGLKAVQRELRRLGSQTLPRSAGSSISHALMESPSSPIPSIRGGTTTSSEQTPKDTQEEQRHIPSWIPPPPSAPAPIPPDRIRKTASFKHVGFSSRAEKSDLIVSALREVFRQKQLLQRDRNADGSQTGSDTNNDMHP